MSNSKNPFASVQPQETDVKERDLTIFMQMMNELKKEPKKDKQPDYIACLLEVAGKFQYLRDPFKNYYAVICEDEKEEIVPIESKKFKKLLNRELKTRHGKLLSEKSLVPVIWEISLSAEKTAKDCPFIRRVAADKEALYIDRGTTPASFIRVDHTTAEKKLVTKVPFIPRTFSSNLPIEFPMKSDGRQFERFFERMALTDTLDQLLVCTFLVSKLFYEDLTPILAITGPENSGKSVLADAIKSIIDPSFELSNLPDKKSNLIQIFDHQFLPGIDNISSISKDYSDLFCTMYTGGACSKRVEFSVDDEHVYAIKNSGILVFIKMKNIPSDLLSRMFFIKREQFHESETSDTNLRKSINNMHPYLLDELLDLYVQVRNIRDYGDSIKTRDRSKDFVAIGKIIADVVFNDESLIDKLVERNFGYRYDLKVTNNEAVSAMISLLSGKQGYTGTMTQIKEMIIKSGGYLNNNLHNPATFAKQINEGEDLLREKGITFTKGTKGNVNSMYTFVNHNFVVPESKPKSNFDRIYPEIAATLTSKSEPDDSVVTDNA